MSRTPSEPAPARPLALPPSVRVAAFGVRTGLILPNDNIAAIVADAVGDWIEDGDIVCVTEAVVARSQNRYLSCRELADDIRAKLDLKPGARLAVVSPIASRNRFALVLRAAAMATRGGTVVVQFSLPYDEVGNQVIDPEFARTRLRLKKVYKSLLEARGNTPHLNILIREVVAALVLQQHGFQILAMRKIMGRGIADVTVRDPGGAVAPLEVTFSEVEKAVRQAAALKADMPEATRAYAATVDLARRTVTLYDAATGGAEPAVVGFYPYGDVEEDMRDPEAIAEAEVGEGAFRHPITGVDYRRLYRETILAGGAQAEVFFAENPLKVYDRGYLDGVILGEVHGREASRELFLSFGARVPVVTLDEIGPPPWGVIGSNVSNYDECRLKLLPEDADATAEAIRRAIRERSRKDVEVLIFGDGAYKDPDTGIYELADPYPAIGQSEGLRTVRLRTGLKLKMHVDTLYQQGLSREEIASRLSGARSAGADEVGTTPRNLSSLVATLADLVAGSADAGTPIVVVRGYLPLEGR
ncbi:coenzyme F420-0:L-glutamate ligase [Hydrogenibacillus sp. N12]|uniref:coenzyme F420-0:L-glutamate ligase n=1 Tax=Hydrogenibacillus sp. N12 TaxID=2866627 RepID=UPI001C7D1FEB|nr:coenzyme F420-0:L-glutamate ligase [Hydrogenibacillus sp. N12]QZA33760.1 coenzyme F420-0:L-glutamate ligase [Hydrogenibacillus sp. N12]